MTDVVYTADEGYYFPTDYAVASVNGIGVTRDSYTQITVSGTPTDDAAVTLTAPTAKTAEDTPAAVFTATGPDGGTLGSVTSTMRYSTDGGTTWNDVTGTSIDVTGVTAENGVQVKQPATDTDTKTDSAVQTIAVTKADTPASPSAADCSGTANNDGRLIGVTAAMEYKKSDDTSWTSGTGSDLTGLVPGTYCVRVKASGTALASDVRYLTISAYTALPTVETPVLPAAGSFTGSMTVTITCATDGADIYYTTDGSFPSTNGMLYYAPFTVSETVTVNAVALKAGMADSEIAFATYTLSPAGETTPPAEGPAENPFVDVAEDA